MRPYLFILVCFLIFTFSFSVSAQQEFRSSRDSQWLMQLRPNMTHSAYWFYWSGGNTPITMDAQLETPTSWISAITLTNPTSSSCSEIGTMKLDIVAPSMSGIYTAKILDLNSHYDPINITFLVSEDLRPLDSLNITGFVNQEMTLPEPIINDGQANLGCLDPFYPSDSQSYEFIWITNGMPGTITTTPSEFTLVNDEQIILQHTATFTEPGNYTAFRLGKVEFSSSLWVLKVKFAISENPAGIGQFSSENSNVAFPNPATDYVSIPSEAAISLYSMDGKFIRNIGDAQNQASIKIDISDLKPGIYIAKSGVKSYRIVKQ